MSPGPHDLSRVGSVWARRAHITRVGQVGKPKGARVVSEPVHVEVEVPAPEPETQPETVPSVTVVETGTESDNGITATVIDHEGELASLRAEIDELRSRLSTAEAAASVAQATADVAIEATDEAVAEVAEIVAESEPQPEADDDTEPNREHWFFR